MVKPKKNKVFLKWINDLIDRKEKIIVERKGAYPKDFDMLIRYLEVRKFYAEDEN